MLVDLDTRRRAGRPRPRLRRPTGPSSTAAATPPNAIRDVLGCLHSAAYENRNRRARLRRAAARRRVLRGGPRGHRPRPRRAQGRGARRAAISTSRTSRTIACARSRTRFHATTRYADLAKVRRDHHRRAHAAHREPRARPPAADLLGTALAGVLQEGQLVVLESTTYPGTTREQLVPLLEESGLAGRPRLQPRPSRPSASTPAAPTTRCAPRPRSWAA